MITVAVPNKGRLHEPALNLLERAGIKVEEPIGRRLKAGTSDPEVEVMFVRAADIPRLVEEGAAELGITGHDLVVESGAEVEELLDLRFGRARMVLAVPEESDVEEPEDLEGGTVATEFPNITRRYFEEEVGVEVEVVEVTGATEVMPRIGVADAVVDLSSTGTTLRVNRLRVVDEILETSARLIAHPDAVESETVQRIKLSLEGVLNAEGKKLIMMNVPRDRLDEFRELLPGVTGPTVSKILSREDMVELYAVVDEEEVSNVILRAKELGAEGIIVLPIERMIP